MAVHSPPTSHAAGPTGGLTHRARFTVTAWVLGILGAIATLESALILFAGDDQWIGIGGQASWRVGDVDSAWGYGLLTGGVLALLATLALVIRARTMPARQADEMRSGWTDVATHAAVFVAVNTFLWIQDIALGDGLNYAYWITIPWAIGLAAHALAQYRATRRSSTPTR
jgi:hypothetical protein